MNYLKIILIVLLITAFANRLMAQIHSEFDTPIHIDDNTGSSIQNDAALEISSTSKGVLIPRLSASQRLLINSPSEGLLVYDIDSSSFFYGKGGLWEKIPVAANIQGVEGPQGPTGPQGPIGPTGAGGDTHMSGTNLKLGTSAGANITSGLYNALSGLNSGHSISTGGFNAYLGGLSGTATNGSFNVGIGYRTGGTVGQTGTIDHNVSIGSVAGAKYTDASFNVVIGSGAGSHLNVGNSNIMIGYATSGGLNTASNNLYLGNLVANLNEDGNENTIVGNNAGQNLSNSSNNLFLGRHAGFSLSSSSNKLIVENSSSSMPLLFGDFTEDKLGVNWDWSNAIPSTLSVNGSASKSTAGDWLANSDKRLKTKITHLSSSLMLKKLLQMQGVSYEWNDNVTGFERPLGRQFGFLAQDIEKIWPDNVKEDNQGYKMTSYGTYDYLYVESIKALHQENQLLKSEIETLNIRLQKIESLLSN